MSAEGIMGKASLKRGGWHFTGAAIKTLQHEGLGTVCSQDSEQWKRCVLSPVAARAHAEPEVAAEHSGGRDRRAHGSDVKAAPSPERGLGLSGFP